MDAPPESKYDAAVRRLRQRRFPYHWAVLGVALVTLVIALAVWIWRAERQRWAVAGIEAAGGHVFYDYRPFQISGTLPGPDWLCRLLGKDYLADVREVSLMFRADEATLAYLSGLPELQELDVSYSQVSNAGMEHVLELTDLRSIDLTGSEVSPWAVTRLQSELPGCYIHR
jgi:hypothetical protein